ncbi:TSUP family transporter [Streptomyces noursei]|uniref:TSUP family transporter n=1 Tax=Streptomyces noursei TaxID=1971 RepID=UPI0019BC2FF6|nr:TSUP family transporter [Streptomyces noursei]MCZ1013374.1 TSUP family transporter [Streptomyces noursei]GGX47365.1 UPF0721 transmembrane protein [Streptomyces noursei]
MTYTDLWAPLDWPGFGGVTLVALLFLCVTALLAGAVDAIVGGGGLLQLPAMLLVNPGGAVVHSLATSKMVGLVGTTAAAVTFARKTPLDWKAVGQMAATTFPASVAGAAVASALPKSVLNTVVLCALVIVGLYTWRKPEFGVDEDRRFGRRGELIAMAVGGAAIGFWDGLGPPGTGSFLVFLLVGVIGYAFLRASAVAKVVNIAANLGALVFFIPAGKVLWGLGGAMAVCNLAGGILGASLAMKRGSTFVRKVFLVVVSGLVISVTWKLSLA